MYPISVCMIAKNEEDHIEECLKRLRPCKFEIIIVDTGSTDKTVELASKYTNHVYRYEWCDDFSAARNFSIEKASNDWVLVIDCDEYLENVNLMYLEEDMEKHPEEVGRILRNNPYMIQGNRSIMSERIGRLFNRNYCHFEGMIHEQVCRKDGSRPNSFDISFTLYHEGYVTESGKRLRAARNLEMLLLDLKSKGPTPYICYQLGQNYVSLSDTDKAISYFEQGLKLQADKPGSLGRSLVEAYGYCMLESGQYERSLSLVRYYSTYQDHADFVFLMGMIYSNNNRLEDALTEFERATTLTKCSRKGVNSYRAFFNMASIYEKLGDREKAISLYKKCGDFEPAAKRLEEICA